MYFKNPFSHISYKSRVNTIFVIKNYFYLHKNIIYVDILLKSASIDGNNINLTQIICKNYIYIYVIPMGHFYIIICMYVWWNG